MIEPDEQPTLRYGREGCTSRLPFRWLTQVWAPGMCYTAGRFVLDAKLERGQLSLLTADPDGGSQSTLTLQLS